MKANKPRDTISIMRHYTQFELNEYVRVSRRLLCGVPCPEHVKPKLKSDKLDFFAPQTNASEWAGPSANVGCRFAPFDFVPRTLSVFRFHSKAIKQLSSHLSALGGPNGVRSQHCIRNVKIALFARIISTSIDWLIENNSNWIFSLDAAINFSWNLWAFQCFTSWLRHGWTPEHNLNK